MGGGAVERRLLFRRGGARSSAVERERTVKLCRNNDYKNAQKNENIFQKPIDKAEMICYNEGAKGKSKQKKQIPRCKFGNYVQEERV